MEKPIRKAVSIILKCHDEIFIIKRQNFLKAFPGYSAFPGGKLDKTDQQEKLFETLKYAAIREIKEELELDIKSNFPSEIYAKATSPHFNPLRYETYFFVVEFNDIPALKLDENEFVLGEWKKPIEILKEFDFGNRLMVYPVRKVIESFVNEKTQDLLSFDEREEKIPTIQPLKNLFQVMPLSNTVPPASRTNCFIIGDKKKILIDPSPKNKDEYLNFLEEVKKYDIDKIVISHHHKDHHQFSTNLAKTLNLPLYISQDSFNRVNLKYGESYFSEIEVHMLKDGQEIGVWLGESILCHAIPGHDEGHMGFAPISLKWFIVGDLFQGIGTVVVGGEEGDMQKYMQSLKKVIELNPNCVIPSHGIALGGTNILQKTYDHRLLREAQVLDLHQSGHDTNQILAKIYFDLPRKLIPYAKANIESHLEKLKKENKI